MADLPYVIVPAEATDEMLKAGRSHAVPSTQAILPIYRAMLSASDCPVSLDEIVGVLESLFEDERFHVGIGGNPHAVEALIDKARSLLHRLKAQTPGKE